MTEPSIINNSLTSETQLKSLILPCIGVVKEMPSTVCGVSVPLIFFKGQVKGNILFENI